MIAGCWSTKPVTPSQGWMKWKNEMSVEKRWNEINLWKVKMGETPRKPTQPLFHISSNPLGMTEVRTRDPSGEMRLTAWWWRPWPIENNKNFMLGPSLTVPYFSMDISSTLFFYGREATESYCTYSIHGKTEALAPEFVVEDLPLAELQPRLLHL